MALSIEDTKTERLARELANETGESVAQAVHRALQERAQRLRKTHRASGAGERLLDILRRVDSLPTLDTRPEEDILGYGSEGIPR